jgi:hypothetical protein
MHEAGAGRALGLLPRITLADTQAAGTASCRGFRRGRDFRRNGRNIKIRS